MDSPHSLDSSSNDNMNAVAVFGATSRMCKLRAAEAVAALEKSMPLLIETLRSHWSTGQGTRVRHILWSLYTCSHLVNLGDACTGLDADLAQAVQAAIVARLALGPESEQHLRDILKASGEFARFDEVEKLTLDHLPVIYPPNATDAADLRRLADAAESLARSRRRWD